MMRAWLLDAVPSRLESCSVLVTRASTRQHEKILISGTIGAFRSKKKIDTLPPAPAHFYRVVPQAGVGIAVLPPLQSA